MKKVNWGELYNKYHHNQYNSEKMEKIISELIDDWEVSRNEGVYEFVFDGDSKHLNLRTFDKNTKQITYKKQKGICPLCKKHFEIDKMQGDHWIPWSKGGTTTPENCAMLCISCNIIKSNKEIDAIKLKAYK